MILPDDINYYENNTNLEDVENSLNMSNTSIRRERYEYDFAHIKSPPTHINETIQQHFNNKASNNRHNY
jgi:hypothetical protein